MSELQNLFVESLRLYARGAGIQRFQGGAAPIDGVPAPADAELEGLAEASLDFVLADPSWVHETEFLALLRQWRRLLKPGGVLAAVVPQEGADPALFAYVLGREVGIVLETSTELGAGHVLLACRRDPIQAMRRGIAALSAELGWRARPEGWREELHFGLGTLQLEAGEGEGAARSFENVLAVHPDNLEARVGLGLARTLQGRLAEAEEVFDAVLARAPGHDLARAWKAQIEAQRKAAGGIEVPRPQAPAATS